MSLYPFSFFHALNRRVLFRVALLTGAVLFIGIRVARAGDAPASLTLYVAPTGDDHNDGSVAHPFASLERARDVIRERRAAFSGNQLAHGVEVVLRGGVYPREKTFELGKEDSIGGGISVTYRSAAGESARLVGGKPLRADWFSLVSSAMPEWHRLLPEAQGHVLVVDLRAHGLSGFGTLSSRGMHHPGAGAMELFEDERPLPLAQWPRSGSASLKGMGFGFTRIAKGSEGTTLLIADDELKRWREADQIWLHGYWGNLWSDFIVPAASVDTAHGTVTLASAPPYPIKPSFPFRVYNLLEEIGAPGDWFLDRKAGKLYLWPTQTWPRTSLYVSTLSDALVRLKDTDGITLEGLVLDMSWGKLISIQGGSGNTLRRCVLENTGADGAVISGSGNGLDGCVVENTGECGVRLSGGSRPMLTSAGNFVINCRISHFSRSVWTYTPGVEIQGVGQVVSHNEISDAPHEAIQFFGNNHRIDFNDIHDVCLFSSDAGAIYAGRRWDFRGTVIKNNFIHEMRSPLEAPHIGENGVYLDDAMSGTVIAGNLFYRISGDAILANGGRENKMTGNIIAKCGTALEVSAFGVKHATDKAGSTWNLIERLSDERVRYREQPWASAYPELAVIPLTWAEVRAPGAKWLYPEGSTFEGNICWQNEHYIRATNTGDRTIFDQVFHDKGNVQDASPGFRNEQAGDFAMDPASLANLLPGFSPIPLAVIGPDQESRWFWSHR